MEFKETKYLVVNEGETVIDVEVYDRLEVANNQAGFMYEGMTDHDKKNSHVYVIDVTEDDLEEPEDWSSFISGGYCDGRFDSERWYAVLIDDDDNDWGIGSRYEETARKMAREMDAKYIAVILGRYTREICDYIITL